MKKKLVIEVEDSAEDEQLETYLNAEKWRLAVWNLDQWLRELSKYQNQETIGVDVVRDNLQIILTDYDLTL